MIDKKINALIQNNKKLYISLFLWSLIFTIISVVAINVSNPPYDYQFHMIRIIGFADSLKNGDFLPNLNHIFSYGTGYASNMFYGSWQLYLPALVMIVFNNPIISYTSFAAFSIVLTSFSTYFSFEKIINDRYKSFLIALITPCFFPIFGFGMTYVVFLVPLLFYAIYKVIYLDKKNPVFLGVVIAILVQTHTLSTLILGFISLVFVLFSFKKITSSHLLSFFLSLILSIFLSSGYIFQYIEQVKSQHFYFSWTTRNFPVARELLFNLDNGFNSGFSPLKSNYDLLLKVFFIYFILKFKSLKNISKTMLLTVLIVYLSMTKILPWYDSLRYTFLGTLQYTERLYFFLPILLLLIIGIELHSKILKPLLISVVAFYLLIPIFKMSVWHYSSSMLRMKDNSDRITQMYHHSNSQFASPSGDEYYTLDINHDNVRKPNFGDFSQVKNVLITNVSKKYNRLDFDYKIIDENQEASVILPKIWYKGYQADYSNYGKGSQPYLDKRNRTEAEKFQMKQLSMPYVSSQKVLNDGKIKLSFQKSGHVSILYKKTTIQKIGYGLEFISWLSLVVIAYLKNIKYNFLFI
ncbi:hypothetical protein [Streptococcus zalophi]|uniref:hypothetical protein n=1 Tax=Streptococcus zalophi TaxID=640031 RepID=UPI00215C6314|nr:hypothetical protein [Streptococcus zalophi]MCR8967467.1 hypothetical protein [Streptococcus zalophi]